MIQRSNAKGRATAFVTLSRFRSVWHEAWANVTFLAASAGIDESRARALSFLHHAYWVVLRPPSDGSRRRRGRGELLFISAFAGDWEDYLAGFRLINPRLMNLVWGQCENWPKSVQVPAFLDYVRDRQPEVAAFFNAYGDADVRDIRAALRTSDAWDRLTRELPALSDEQLQAAYQKFALDVMS